MAEGNATNEAPEGAATNGESEGTATNEEQGTTEQEAAKRPRRSLSSRAAKSLRRARSTYVEGEWEDSNQASYYLQEANVLALMDLARAVRESQGPSESENSSESGNSNE
jgi:hypothetical protein